MLYEDLRNTPDKLVPFSAKCQCYIFVGFVCLH